MRYVAGPSFQPTWRRSAGLRRTICSPGFEVVGEHGSQHADLLQLGSEG